MDSPNSSMGSMSPVAPQAHSEPPVAGPSNANQQGGEQEHVALGDSFFPNPPNWYKRYTGRNLEFAERSGYYKSANDESKGKSKEVGGDDEGEAEGRWMGVEKDWGLEYDWRKEQEKILGGTTEGDEGKLLAEGESLPDFDLRELRPPRVDWIVEDGHWECFGEAWPIEEKLPTLEEMGVKQLYPPDQDRRQSLLSLLHTILQTYLQLLTALQKGPPSLAAQAAASGLSQVNWMEEEQSGDTDVQRCIEHIRLASLNMHYLMNELRPVQARETLELMLKGQIQQRKERTAELKRTCQDLRQTITAAKAKYKLETPNDSSGEGMV